MSEEIIAYRISEGLFCPDCYEKAAKTLKAVQNPEDPQVTFPAKPIKVGDMNIFICTQCKTIMGSDRYSGEKIEIPQRKDLNELRDMVEDSVSKIAFLGDFFSRGLPDDELFSSNGISGLGFILRDLEDDLRFVVNEISQRQQKGIIKEMR